MIRLLNLVALLGLAASAVVGAPAAAAAPAPAQGIRSAGISNRQTTRDRVVSRMLHAQNRRQALVSAGACGFVLPGTPFQLEVVSVAVPATYAKYIGRRFNRRPYGESDILRVDTPAGTPSTNTATFILDTFCRLILTAPGDARTGQARSDLGTSLVSFYPATEDTSAFLTDLSCTIAPGASATGLGGIITCSTGPGDPRGFDLSIGSFEDSLNFDPSPQYGVTLAARLL